MAERTFNLTLPPESRTLRPASDGRGVIAYTVKNAKAFPVRCSARVVAKDPMRAEWLSIDGSDEREFGGEESQQFKVKVSIPTTTPQANFGFRLDVASVANPQEDFTEGDPIAIDWKPPAVKEARRFPWMIVLAAAVVLLAIGVVTLLLTRGKRVPSVVGKDAVSASSELANAGLKVGAVSHVVKPNGPAAGVVLSQTPAANEKVKAGTLVALEVQGSPTPVVPPPTPTPMPPPVILKAGAIMTAVQVSPKTIRFRHAGAYVAKFYATWSGKDGKPLNPPGSWESGNTTVGFDKTITIPGDARNIHVWAEAATGLVWDPWGKIFDERMDTATNQTFRATGTTLNRSWDHKE